MAQGKASARRRSARLRMGRMSSTGCSLWHDGYPRKARFVTVYMHHLRSYSLTVQSERRRRILIAAGAVAGFALLASAMNGFELADGLRIQPTIADTIDEAFELQRRTTGPAYAGGVALAWIVTAVVSLSVVMFIIGLIRRENRASTLLLVAIGGVAALLIPRITVSAIDPEEAVTQALVPGAGSDMPITGELMDEEDAVDVSVERDTSLGAISWILAAVAAVAVLFVVRPKLPRLASRSGREGEDTIEEITREAIERAESGTDVLATVVRYYEEVLELYWSRRYKGRVGSITPGELAIRLIDAGVPPDAVTGLTRLFERARYGEIVLSPEEEAEAIGYLRSIQGALGEADG